MPHRADRATPILSAILSAVVFWGHQALVPLTCRLILPLSNMVAIRTRHEGHRKVYSASLTGASKKVCLTIAVNLLVKITSGHSRPVCRQADIEFDPVSALTAQWPARSGRRQWTEGVIESRNGSAVLTHETVRTEGVDPGYPTATRPTRSRFYPMGEPTHNRDGVVDVGQVHYVILVGCEIGP